MAFKKQYLNPPDGAKISGKPVAMTDFDGLRNYAHSLRTPEDVDYHSTVDEMDAKELRLWFQDQGYTFDALENTNWQDKSLADGQQ